MIDYNEILCNANWAALAIAIYYSKPVTVEEAFQIYDDGKIEKTRIKRYGLNKHDECLRMHERGICNKDIGLSLGINQKNIQSYIWHAKHGRCRK